MGKKYIILFYERRTHNSFKGKNNIIRLFFLLSDMIIGMNKMFNESFIAFFHESLGSVN